MNNTKDQLLTAIERLQQLNDYTKQYDDWVMNTNQLLVLLETAVYPEKSLGAVTMSVGISQPTMWRTVEKFEKRGLGKKVTDAFDHRTHYFKLSPKAKDLLQVDS